MSITAAIALAKFVPDVLRWFGGDKQAEVADKVLGVARNLTGIDDPAAAAAAIEADRALQVQLAQAMQPVIIAQYQAESAQLETVNATMRAEIQSDDKFKSYWRPFFGYMLALSWGAMMLAIVYAVVTVPEKSILIISAFGSMTAMWGVALAVLGVQISARSKDKQVANGQTPADGLMAALAKRVAGK